ncbi:MAG: insulinase family protein [Candidatus Aminicenantes bacterium]|nr:insulinase family protein [Candidatus Aminicenantes bacterium]
MKKLSTAKYIKFFCAVLVAALFLFAPGLTAKTRKVDKIKYPQLNKFQLPEIAKAQTANSIKLRLIKEEKLPIIELDIIIKGGEAYEPGAKAGLASVMARLLRIGGTKNTAPDKLDLLLDSKGITISFSAGTDYFNISLTCLKENFPAAVAVLAEMMQFPAFDKEKLEEIKTQYGSTVSRRNDDPGSINNREFKSLIYGKDSPFAAVLEYEYLENIGREDIAGFYGLFFAPDNMLTGVTGPIEMAEVKAVFEKHFGAWKRKARLPAYPVVKKQALDFKVAFAEKSSLNQSYLSIGHLGIEEDVADYKEKAKIKIFNSIFSRGFTSRLVRRVRVKMGLTYGIGGGIGSEYLYPGSTSFSTFTKSESTITAIKAIFDEIDIIRKEKVSAAELQDAKDYFLNSYVFNFSTPQRILYSELEREFYGVPADFQENLLDSIKGVTADDVLQTAQKYLHPDKMIVFILGKEEDIEGKLSELGKVKKIDISIPPPPLKEEIPEATPQMLEKGREKISALLKGKYRGYKKLKTMTMEMDTTLTMQGRTLPIAVKATSLFPDKSYSVMTVMGMKIEVIVNGDEGVMRQMGQERPMPKEDIENNNFGELYHIFNSKDKYKFQYLKEVEVDGKQYDVIYMFDAAKNWQKLFINKETQFIEIEEKVSKLPGTSGIAREVKSGFKVISGIPVAYRSKTYVKDKVVSEVEVKSVKVNPVVDKKLFDLKKKK